MKKYFFIILLLLLTASCAQSKLDCRGKDPRCTDETGFDLIDIDFFWYGNVSYRKEKTRFVFITNIGRELVIIVYFLVMADNICYVYFLKNEKNYFNFLFTFLPYSDIIFVQKNFSCVFFCFSNSTLRQVSCRDTWVVSNRHYKPVFLWINRTFLGSFFIVFFLFIW